MFIEDVIRSLEKHSVKYAIAGGYALVLHGALRATIDVDLVIQFSAKAFENAEKALKELGLLPRLPVTAKEVFQFREEYIRNKNLVAWTFIDPKNPVNILDILIIQDLDDTEVVTKKFAKLNLKVISIKDLIKMKKKSGRPQDLADVEALEKL